MTIIQAINTHQNLEDMQGKLAIANVSIADMEKRIKELKTQKEALEREMEELNIRVGSFTERTKLYRELHNILNLMTQPAKTQLDPIEFMYLVQSFLLGVRLYSKTHVTGLTKWTLYVSGNLDKTVNALNNILMRDTSE